MKIFVDVHSAGSCRKLHCSRRGPGGQSREGVAAACCTAVCERASCRANMQCAAAHNAASPGVCRVVVRGATRCTIIL